MTEDSYVADGRVPSKFESQSTLAHSRKDWRDRSVRRSAKRMCWSSWAGWLDGAAETERREQAEWRGDTREAESGETRVRVWQFAIVEDLPWNRGDWRGLEESGLRRHSEIYWGGRLGFQMGHWACLRLQVPGLPIQPIPPISGKKKFNFFPGFRIPDTYPNR